MIKKLQFKFVLIIMTIFTIVLFGILCSLNIDLYLKNKNQIDMLFNQMFMENNKTQPHFAMQSPNSHFSGTIFTIKENHNGQLVDVALKSIEEIEQEDIERIHDLCKNSKKVSGKIENYNFKVYEVPYGKFYVYIDNTMFQGVFNRQFILSIIIGVLSWLLIFIISIYLAKKLTKPVEIAIEKQKQFISDAGHEIKTPLTTISTNIALIDVNDKDKQQIDSIKNEIKRLTDLTNNLLTLSRLENVNNKPQFSEFDLSDVVNSTILSFEATIFEIGKHLEADIDDDIYIFGNAQQFIQLSIIFIDNAIKYSDDGGSIRVTLKKKNSKVYLSFYNTGQGLSKENYNAVFERFYRLDCSRDRRTGGYGLGLSIADRIIKLHNGKINIDGEEGKWINFSLSFNTVNKLTS